MSAKPIKPHADDKLPEKRLHELLAYHYGVTLNTITPATKGWQLETDRGMFTLFRVRKMDEAYWEMIERLLIHLRKNGLPQFPQLIRTKRDKLAFHGFHGRYLLMNSLYDERCEWKKTETWESIGKTLASVHQASRNFPLMSKDQRFQAAGRWSLLWGDHLEWLDTVRTACALSENKRPVDRLWLRVHTYTVTMIETALRYLEKAGGDEEVLKQMEGGVIGHHHLRRGSWGADHAGTYRLLDWEQLVLDIRVRDLAQMIHLARGPKRMFTERVQWLLAGYESVQPLKETEWPMLYARTLFPERLVRGAMDIYVRRDITDDAAFLFLQRMIADQQKCEYHARFIPHLIQSVSSVKIPRVDWLK